MYNDQSIASQQAVVGILAAATLLLLVEHSSPGATGRLLTTLADVNATKHGKHRDEDLLGEVVMIVPDAQQPSRASTSRHDVSKVDESFVHHFRGLCRATVRAVKHVYRLI